MIKKVFSFCFLVILYFLTVRMQHTYYYYNSLNLLKNPTFYIKNLSLVLYLKWPSRKNKLTSLNCSHLCGLFKIRNDTLVINVRDQTLNTSNRFGSNVRFINEMFSLNAGCIFISRYSLCRLVQTCFCPPRHARLRQWIDPPPRVFTFCSTRLS